MSLSPEQIKELNKYQQKFLNGEITAQEYEFSKSEILGWKNEESTKEARKHGSSGIFNVSKKYEEERQEVKDDNLMLGNIIYNVFAWFFKILGIVVKNIVIGIRLVLRFIHKNIQALSKKKNMSLGKLYTIIGIIGIMLFLGTFGVIASMNTYSEHKRMEYNKKLSEERKIEEQQENEKRMIEQKAIDEEKAKTPKPSITLLSSTGNQGKRTEYILKFSSTGADTVTINSEKIEPTGSGTYEKKIALGLGETSITILAKNKYFSDTLGFLVSREKTDEEIQAEKEAEERLIAEQKEAERLALEEERRMAEKKRQELENEKKTYKSITYALLAKNPDKYKTERIRFKGKIFNADEEGGISVFQINTDGYGYGDQIFTVANWSNDYVEGNWVTVWGEVAGEYCYQSQAGWDICVPSVKANIIE